MAGHTLFELADTLLASPLGCSFLDASERSGFGVDDISDPTTAFFLAGRAWGMITPWSATQAPDIAELLRRSPRWVERAHALVEDPRNAWWFEDLRRADQLMIRQAEPPVGWSAVQLWDADKRAAHERYSQQPVYPTCTSTAFDGLSSYLVSASEIVEDLGPLAFPVQRILVTVSPDARVFEVHDAEGWSELCRRYPAHTPGGLHGGSLVPDFSLAASDWDGVHLSFGGLLTATHVPVEGPGGRTLLEGWEAEQTVWLNPSFDDETRLPDLEQRLEVPFALR